MAGTKERIRGLRQVEQSVLSKVENANGVVTLLKELGRQNETSVAVAAAQCLRRVFSQLLDPVKNPQLPRPAPEAATAAQDGRGKNTTSTKKRKKKRPRDDVAEDGRGGSCNGTADAVGDGEGESDGSGGDDKAARVYQGWLEARYLDFLRALLGWVAEVDDFRRQGPALRTIMHFVELEPSLCVSAAAFAKPWKNTSSGLGDDRDAGEEAFTRAAVWGQGTIWGGLFAELVRAVILGPCSMETKLLKALGEEFVNVHDDIRYYLLGNVTAMARRALIDHQQASVQDDEHRVLGNEGEGLSEGVKDTGDGDNRPLPLHAESPLRGYAGAAAAFRGKEDGGFGGERTVPSSVIAAKTRRDRKKRKKAGAGLHAADEASRGGDAADGRADGRGIERQQDQYRKDDGEERLGLDEVSGRLARVLMVVRMVEEQSDLSAFLLPVELSLPSSPASIRTGAAITGGNRKGAHDARGNASSSESEGEDEEELHGLAAAKKHDQNGGKAGADEGGIGKGGRRDAGPKGRKRLLAIERLRYHKKAFGDAWLACLRLPLPPALYRRVLLFLPGDVIPYMPSPVRLADFLTEAYERGGVQSVLALDALFFLMQAHDLEYPGFYDSLYRLVTPTIMHAKYKARFFRMVDLCLSSSHVPAYVVAAFLKRFARTTLQAPPSCALFTLALTRKLIGRHPECLSLISNTTKVASPSPGTNAMPRCNGNPVADTNGTGPSVEGAGDVTDESVVGGSVGDGNMKSTGLESENGTQGFVDEYDPEAEDTKGAGALKTSLWELAALQNHYHPAVATLARGFLEEGDKKEVEGEVFAAPSKLAGESYQSLFDQEMRRKIGKVALAFRKPKGIFDDVPEEGGGVFAALNFSL